MDQPALSSRLPSLDGWRAISIVMVLGWHTKLIAPEAYRPILTWIFDGDLGVRFFFVISGFLITWLMVQEAGRSGQVSLKHFYIRRALRILPVYFAFVLVLFFLQIWTPFTETTGGWIGVLTFTRNFVSASMASVHLWSLSVEEQFYLIWPGLFVLACHRRLRSVVLLLAVPILIAPFFRAWNFVLFTHHKNLLSGLNGFHMPAPLERLFFMHSFFCYFDSLACGCLCAIILFYRSETVGDFFKQWRMPLLMMGVVLVIAPHVYFICPLPRPFGVPANILSDSLQALGFSLLLLQSVKISNWGIYRLLNWKPMVWLGMLSYSLYIWQEIFMTRPWRANLYINEPFWHDDAGIHPLSALSLNFDSEKINDPFWAWFWLVPTFAAAIISFYGLERPLFRLRSRFRDSNPIPKDTPPPS